MNAIAAVNLKGYIGKGGDLMYDIKEDLAFFARTTKGKTLVMGTPSSKSPLHATNNVSAATISIFFIYSVFVLDSHRVKRFDRNPYFLEGRQNRIRKTNPVIAVTADSMNANASE